jgi:hypothetical protein
MKRSHSEDSRPAKRARPSSQAEDFAILADSLAVRPDLMRSDPLPREDPYVVNPWASLAKPEPSRPALARLSRADAASRPRRTAIEVPNAPRRRGENRAASTFNRAPGWMPPRPVMATTEVIDLT